MKVTLHKAIGATAMLAMLAGPAMAQPYQGPDQNHGGPQGQYASHPSGGPGPMQHEQPQHEEPQHEQPQHEAYAPNHGNWHEGDHYNGQRAVVNDWSHHHLHQPPAGYEWVQSGDQFVLIAVSTGIIASIIAGSMAQ